jgi:hypothetical protein
VDLSGAMPFMLEDELNKSDWDEKVVVSRGGRLITGQNPASAG